MMTSQPLASIIVENQVINWKVISGIAVGVQKYSKNHVSGGETTTYTVEIVVECTVQQNNGEEIPVKLSAWEHILKGMKEKEGFEEIRLRDGQSVSLICGYTEDRSSDWLIFINHDTKKWHWLNLGAGFFLNDIPTLAKFLDNFGVFEGDFFKKFLWGIDSYYRYPLWLGMLLLFCLYLSVATVIGMVFLYIESTFRIGMLQFIRIDLITLILLAVTAPLFKIWKEKINPSRQILKLQIAEMARSLL